MKASSTAQVRATVSVPESVCSIHLRAGSWRGGAGVVGVEEEVDVRELHLRSSSLRRISASSISPARLRALSMSTPGRMPSDWALHEASAWWRCDGQAGANGVVEGALERTLRSRETYWSFATTSSSRVTVVRMEHHGSRGDAVMSALTEGSKALAVYFLGLGSGGRARTCAGVELKFGLSAVGGSLSELLNVWLATVLRLDVIHDRL
jgi:hypothetical protein